MKLRSKLLRLTATLFAILTAALPSHATESEATPDASYNLPQLYRPVDGRLDHIDNAIRRAAWVKVSEAQAKARREAQERMCPAPALPYGQYPKVEGTDSIIVAGGIAIHPADTLDTTPDRYYQTYVPVYYTPLIFDTYEYLQPLTIKTPDIYDYYLSDRRDPFAILTDLTVSDEARSYMQDISVSRKIMKNVRQNFMIEHPDMVGYNMAFMPEPPKHFRAVVEPGTANIKLEEIDLTPADADALPGLEMKPHHWLRSFSASLQFSQAYISPNWYQGGKNNLNGILSLYYNIKLNEKFHPNLLFDTTIQYKLGANSAPDDSIHKMNITEDLFQVYSKFGLKAAHNWYYSVNATFKTQLLNSYPSNSRQLRSAFMSPGELNVGVGMTYSKSTKRVQFNASIAPLSYNLKTCTSHELNPTAFGIKEGHRTKHEFGSSTELTFKWQWAYNIRYQSRLFMFTNYQYAQGDWENTIFFDINKYLSTNVYWHLRYDTSTGRLPDSKWHRFQFKEIFSLGFNYTFKTA